MAHVLAFVTDKERKELCENSVERMINTTLNILHHSTHEDADMNMRDWTELKSVVTKIFNNARDEVFIERMKK